MINEQEFKNIKKGTILSTSWGYDQTNYDYCKVLENTGKTLKCVMVKAEVVSEAGFMSQHIKASNEEYGESFRVKYSRYKQDLSTGWLVGSYPFCDNATAKRRGNWGIWDGEEDLATHYA